MIREDARAAQAGRSRGGLGARMSQKQSAEKEERQAILRAFREITEEERIVDVITNLKYDGEWIKWEAAMRIDKRWHSLLAYESDSALRFRLCETEGQLPTLSMLQWWGHQGYLLFTDFALHEARSFPTHCVPVVLHNSIRSGGAKGVECVL